MFQTVLVPLDGSIFGECALPLAISIARRAGATLRLVQVAHPLADEFFWAPLPGSAVEAQLKERLRDGARSYLESVARRLASAGAGRVACQVEEGEVAESIRRNIARGGADLVVMTSHGRGQVGRIWLGSVADELIRSLEVPVLLVRAAEHPAAPELEREAVCRHILLALDGTALAEQVVAPALAVGRLMDADYTLVRVIGSAAALSHTPDAVGSLQLGPALSAEVGKIKQTLFDEADRYLQAWASRLRGDGVRVQTRVLFAEQPAAGILTEAAAGADLIALETHGRHGLSRLLMGSVADKVVRGSSLPVLVCRAS